MLKHNVKTVIGFFRALVVAFFVFTSCDSFVSCALPDSGRVTIMSYNAETFFDAFEDGVEFDEFKGGKSAWSQERYATRLDRLKEVIFICGSVCGLMPKASPDIVVLQEIENERVLRDISARFTGANTYSYATFIKDGETSAFGIGVLSKYPITSISSHQIESFGVSLRPLLEVCVKAKNKEITIFAVHWKSKSGGDIYNYLRTDQENLLLERIALVELRNPEALWFACGDFNQTLHEFKKLQSYANIWKVEFSPFYGLDARLLGSGSYYYAGAWEGIDHFFFSNTLVDSSGIDLVKTQVVTDSKLLTAGEIPNRYDVFSGKGYSDHLPIIAVLDGF